MAIMAGRKYLKSIFFLDFLYYMTKKYIPSLNNLIKIISKIDVSNNELFDELRIIGTKNAHSNLCNDELIFTANDTKLVSKVIETILYKYFIITS